MIGINHVVVLVVLVVVLPEGALVWALKGSFSWPPSPTQMPLDPSETGHLNTFTRKSDKLAFPKEQCGNTCDNCRSDAVSESKDVTSQAQAALRIVEQLQSENFTVLHAVDILRGKTNPKIRENNHHQMEDYGAASDLPRGEAERIFTRLLLENALREENVVRGGFPNQYIRVSVTSSCG